MTALFERHRPTLEAALQAAAKRDFWSAYPEVPSGKIYGETAKDDGLAAYKARLGHPFALADHPSEGTVGAEVSPYGPFLDITYPAASVDMLVSASRAAAPQWASASPEVMALASAPSTSFLKPGSSLRIMQP